MNKDTHNLITSSSVQGAPAVNVYWCRVNMAPPAKGAVVELARPGFVPLPGGHQPTSTLWN